MNRAHALRLVCSFFTLTLLACSQGPVAGEGVGADVPVDTEVAPEATPVSFEWDPGLSGPFNVGYRTLSFSYAAAGLEGPRVLSLSLWYPTEDVSGEPARYLDLLEDEYAFKDASLASPVSSDGFPLHVHSHGHQGFAGSTNFLMRHFASHGWVVAAPDHAGNTLTDHISPRPPWMYVVRSTDISASLDHLAALDASDPLAGKLIADRVLMSGHSFGGYTTLVSAGATFDPVVVDETCQPSCAPEVRELFEQGVRDPRVIAAIPMAAGNRDMFGGDGWQGIAAPILLMTGDDDGPSNNEAVWQGVSAVDAIRIDVQGGCHQLFGLGACGKIDDEAGFPIVQAYALAFGRFHVLGDEGVASLIDGSEQPFEAVIFHASPAH